MNLGPANGLLSKNGNTGAEQKAGKESRRKIPRARFVRPMKRNPAPIKKFGDGALRRKFLFVPKRVEMQNVENAPTNGNVPATVTFSRKKHSRQSRRELLRL